MQTRNNPSIAEDTVIIHKGSVGRIEELSTIILEELSHLIFTELSERSRDYQGYLESFNDNHPESKL